MMLLWWYFDVDSDEENRKRINIIKYNAKTIEIEYI